ncbi:MAG: hypothetical protein JZU65_20410 [Chlorobium sp.]|nr:hypothetical protein [Chlorobium sp.]
MKILLMAIMQFVLFLMPTVFAPQTVHADATVRYKTFGGVAIDITGTIKPNDYKVVKNEINQYLKSRSKSSLEPFITIFLDTNGGDVGTAINIGKYLRSINAWATVDDNANCLSSCVFILAGATTREIFGRVGIHRPYDPFTVDASYKSQRLKYKKYEKTVKGYLEEMNIQPKLYDDMIYISPQNIKYLSKYELSSYGLVAIDPYTEEANAAEEASRYGISRVEYAKRRAQIDSICGTPNGSDAKEVSDHSFCYHGILMFGSENWREIYNTEYYKKYFLNQ